MNNELITTTHSSRRRFIQYAGVAGAALLATQALESKGNDQALRDKLTSGKLVREACRSAKLVEQTSGLPPGFAQANLVVLPRDLAFEFLLFCRRNPKPCPLLDVTEVGSPTPHAVAKDADLRTDLPKYRVWKKGKLVDEPTEIKALWRDDFVSFVIGCSFTFESALLRAELPVRHIEEKVNVPMYKTNIECRKAGRFHGPIVVSMRPMTPKQAIRAVQVTSRFPDVHGAPIHLAKPEQIGIRDIGKPDFGEAVTIRDGEIPVFWACGVTAQTVLMASKPEMAITHSPGCMFVTDVRDEMLAAG